MPGDAGEEAGGTKGEYCGSGTCSQVCGVIHDGGCTQDPQHLALRHQNPRPGEDGAVPPPRNSV